MSLGCCLVQGKMSQLQRRRTSDCGSTFVLPQIIGWQNGSMPWSGQSHAGWSMLLARHPAGISHVAASTVTGWCYVNSTVWVRWLACHSYIQTKLQDGHWRIFFCFSSFSEAAICGPEELGTQYHYSYLPPASTVSLQPLVLLPVALFWCSNWFCCFFPFLSFNSDFYTQIFSP